MSACRISIFLLAAALPLAGCEMLSGDKGKDGESVGYACRLSDKLPEDCMKENNTYTPTSILTGWKAAGRDIEDKKANSHSPATETGAAGATKPEGGQPAAETNPPAPEEAKH